MQLLISMTHWFSCLTGGNICYLPEKSLWIRSLDWWPTFPQTHVPLFVFFRGSLSCMEMKNGSCHAKEVRLVRNHSKQKIQFITQSTAGLIPLGTIEPEPYYLISGWHTHACALTHVPIVGRWLVATIIWEESLIGRKWKTWIQWSASKSIN